MKKMNKTRVWVVVKAESGIPVLAQVFKDKSQAKKRGKWLQSRSSEERDAVGLFEARLGSVSR
ncbi:MAG: hypothetical protein HZA50_16935 [Planctomycetes bacterium]|nr:hypothetical protein [Planctomycetota bacterium]